MTSQSTQQLLGVMEAPSAVGALKPTLADFDRHRELGRGGNATVYEATWRTTGQRVALKILHGELIADPQARTASNGRPARRRRSAARARGCSTTPSSRR